MKCTLYIVSLYKHTHKRDTKLNGTYLGEWMVLAVSLGFGFCAQYLGQHRVMSLSTAVTYPA